MKILGIDAGISSVGWAMIETDKDEHDGGIIASGVWMFNSPEISSDNGQISKNQKRRQAQGLRRLTKRRRQRMNRIRSLFQEQGLIQQNSKDALHFPSMNPWQLRCIALQRLLSPDEFAKVLSHIAKHRGYQSNTKAEDFRKNKSKDEGRMLSSIDKNAQLVSRYATPAVMLMSDDAFLKKYGENNDFSIRSVRNRDGNYSRTIRRTDLIDEIKTIFKSQRRLGNTFAKKELESKFLEIVEWLAEPQDTNNLVGNCAFEPNEKRCSKLSYSFERFRLLQKLVNMKIVGRTNNKLLPNELSEIDQHFGLSETITYADIRNIISLDPNLKFYGINPKDESKNDVVSKRGMTSPGTYALRNLIAEKLGVSIWETLQNTPAILDQISNVVSFMRKSSSVLEGLSCIPGISPEVVNVIHESWKDGSFTSFVGASHISATVARSIIPGLLKGMTYNDACHAAGYDPSLNNEKNSFKIELDGSVVFGKEALKQILSEKKVDEKLVGSPTARKAIIEILKQVKAIIEEYGMPDRIHVELARDISNSIDKRAEIDAGINKRTKLKKELAERFEDVVKRKPHPGGAGANDLLRFELWEQQGHHCVYTNAYISPEDLFEDNGSFQVDHVLPWSRFGDNSLNNKVLCTSKANQEKQGRTPYEWYVSDKTTADWKHFVATVNGMKSIKGMKKRNLLIEDTNEVEAEFLSRNLTDTRWASKITLAALNYVLPDVVNADKTTTRRVFARPGQITSLFRSAWGLNHIKKDENGKRKSDDRHHALDAIVVAAVTERQLQLATSEVKRLERQGLPIRLSKCISEPWDGFRTEVLNNIDQIFVARQENRRSLRKAHDDTVRSYSERNGSVIVYERKSLLKIKKDEKESVLKRIKDKERNHVLVSLVQEWFNAGMPKDALPILPNKKSDEPPSIISKITLETTNKASLTIPRGTGKQGAVDRGDIVRTDVFSRLNKQGVLQYYLVPIYPHEIVSMQSPPMHYATDSKNNNMITDEFRFIFSLYPNSIVKFMKSGEVAKTVYFRYTDSSNGRIRFLDHTTSNSKMTERISTTTLSEFKKYTVDRLGRVFEVKGEKRIWHGKVCT